MQAPTAYASMNRQNQEFATTLGTDLIEGRAALIDAWLTELGARGRLRPQSSLPVEQLRELMLPVVEWVGLHVRADDPKGVEIDSLRALARSRRSQSYKISEVLDELDVLDQLFFDRAGAIVAKQAVPPTAVEVLEAAERLQEGTSRIRTILVGTFEEDADCHARELSSQMETFVRTLSHEIKNPLGAALSGAELLRDVELRRVVESQGLEIPEFLFSRTRALGDTVHLPWQVRDEPFKAISAQGVDVSEDLLRRYPELALAEARNIDATGGTRGSNTGLPGGRE